MWLQHGDEIPLLSHDDVIHTMEEHHKSIRDTVEAQSFAALQQVHTKALHADKIEQEFHKDIKEVCQVCSCFCIVFVKPSGSFKHSSTSQSRHLAVNLRN